MKTLIQTSKVLILSIAVLTAVSYVQAAWSNPTQSPTGGNTAAPINVSGSNQNKDGGFSAAALVGGIITSPEYCIGSSADNLDCIESWPGGGGSVDTTNLQNRVTGTCSVGQSIIEINEDGTVECGEVRDNTRAKYFQVSIRNGILRNSNIVDSKGVSVDLSFSANTGYSSVTFDEAYDDNNYIVMCDEIYGYWNPNIIIREKTSTGFSFGFENMSNTTVEIRCLIIN